MTDWRDAIKVALALLRVQERAMDAELGILLDRSDEILDERQPILKAIALLAPLVEEPTAADCDKPVEDLPGDVTPAPTPPKFAVPPGAQPTTSCEVPSSADMQRTPGGKAAKADPPPEQKSPGTARCRWCETVRDVRGIRTHERHAHPAEYRQAREDAGLSVAHLTSRPASDIGVPNPAPKVTAPVLIVPRHPNPIERSPIAATTKGPGGPYVCSCGQGFRTAGYWANHRNGVPEKDRKQHRLAEQPVARLVPTGLPAPVNDIQRARTAAFDATD